MRPFSALCYIKENKTRCILLMFMIFLGYGAWLGGLYVTNPFDNWRLALEYSEKMTVVSPAIGDTDCTEYLAFQNELEQSGKVVILEMGNSSGFNWTTIMGFGNGQYSSTFQSVEDFRIYCEYMGIECDFGNLKCGSMIMSELFARNAGLEIGDKIDGDYGENVYAEYTLDALTNEEGYILYFINDEPVNSPSIMILDKKADGKELFGLIYDIQKRHNVSVSDMLRSYIESQFQVFNRIYFLVVVFLSVILAVTINAVFVGMYQRRNFEFAVYRAIGISRRRIAGKIISELLWMDVIALTAGGAVFFLGLYLFNHLALYPAGKYLRYFHPLAFEGLVLCNLLVFVPLMLTRCRQMMKADICEY